MTSSFSSIKSELSDEDMKPPSGAGMYLKFNMARNYIEGKYPIIAQNSEPVEEKTKIEEKPKSRQAMRKLVEELREAQFCTSSSDEY